MGNAHDELQFTNLAELGEELLEKARTSSAQRSAVSVMGSRDSVLRQTVLALLAGAGLGEHDSPPEATLHVLVGRVLLIAGERKWELAAGDLIEIPDERHSVDALEDSVFLLTVIRG